MIIFIVAIQLDIVRFSQIVSLPFHKRLVRMFGCRCERVLCVFAFVHARVGVLMMVALRLWHARDSQSLWKACVRGFCGRYKSGTFRWRASGVSARPVFSSAQSN